MSSAGMIRLRFIFVLLIALVTSVLFAVPGKDAPETAYDESESLPCESAPIVSIGVPQDAAQTPGARVRPLRFGRFRGFVLKHLDQPKDWIYPISDSLTSLGCSLRC